MPMDRKKKIVQKTISRVKNSPDTFVPKSTNSRSENNNVNLSDLGKLNLLEVKPMKIDKTITNHNKKSVSH